MRYVINIALVWIYASLRSLGGRDAETLKRNDIPFAPRVWKRFIAPIYLGGLCILNNLVVGHFHWLILLCVPAFIAGAYCDGYGNDSGVVWREVLQRVLSAFASTAPAIVLCLGSKAWLLLCIQLVLAIAVKVTLNFVKVKAPIEEGIINFLDSVLKPFMV